MIDNLFIFFCAFAHRDTEGRKLCKKVKVDPSSKTKGVEVLHYK